MGSRKLTICVVGTGSIGLRHLNVLKRMPELRVLASPKRSTRVEELRAMGIECIDPAADLERFGLDGAVIASDTAQHMVDALMFPPACPLLIEKPVAIDEAAARTLLSNGRQAAHVACVLRFNPGLTWVRAKLAELGPIQFVDAECFSWLPSWRPSHDYRLAYSSRPAEGGVLRDLIHEIDYLHWLFGPAASVTASVWNTGQLGLAAELDESASATIRTQGGARVALRLSFAMRPASRRLRIWGERGQLTWDGLQRRASHLSSEGSELEAMTWDDSAQMYDDQMASWLRYVREGTSSQLATLADGISALRVVDAIRQSSATGTEIKLS